MFKKAVLIIHGLAGGTYDQEILARYLQLENNFDVFNFTLPGHDFWHLKKTTKEEWLGYAEDELLWLIKHGYKNIYIVGHSMGGIIACYLASKYKEVKRLVLLAPAFNFFALKDKKLSVTNTIKSWKDISTTYKGDGVFSRFLKLPFYTITEYFNMVKDYQKVLDSVYCKTLIIQGKNDFVVPTETGNYVYEKIPSKEKKLVLISDVDHDICRKKRCSEINEIVKKFLQEKKLIKKCKVIEM